MRPSELRKGQVIRSDYRGALFMVAELENGKRGFCCMRNPGGGLVPGDVTYQEIVGELIDLDFVEDNG